jgi:hypothetical protein
VKRSAKKELSLTIYSRSWMEDAFENVDSAIDECVDMGTKEELKKIRKRIRKILDSSK